MNEMKKRRFRTIENDMEEMEQKIRDHRRKIAKVIMLIVLCVILLALFLGLYFKYKTYTDYEVIKKVERQDTTDTQFMEYNGYILKYSNDGAFCTELDDRLVWNQTYEMNHPIVEVNGEYVVIAEQKGTTVYIMDGKGLAGEIETTMPITRVDVGNQGTVAVLMQEGNTSHIRLYHKDGTQIAQGEFHTQNSGFPLAITLSEDAKKMAVSLVKIDDGNITTVINFYNFGTVGQNEIDNVVSSYTYKDVLVPEIEFINNETAIAFGDTQIMIYAGTQKPEEKNVLKLEQQIRDIVYNDKYFGYTYATEKGYELRVYDRNGNARLEQQTDFAYEKIELLSDNELVLINETECLIYDVNGVKRFRGETEKPILKIIKSGTGRQYLFILEGETATIKLK